MYGTGIKMKYTGTRVLPKLRLLPFFLCDGADYTCFGACAWARECGCVEIPRARLRAPLWLLASGRLRSIRSGVEDP